MKTMKIFPPYSLTNRVVRFYVSAASSSSQDPNAKNPKKALIEKVASLGDPRELETYIKRDDWNELTVIAREFQFTHIINRSRHGDRDR